MGWSVGWYHTLVVLFVVCFCVFVCLFVLLGCCLACLFCCLFCLCRLVVSLLVARTSSRRTIVCHLEYIYFFVFLAEPTASSRKEGKRSRRCSLSLVGKMCSVPCRPAASRKLCLRAPRCHSTNRLVLRWGATLLFITAFRPLERVAMICISLRIGLES